MNHPRFSVITPVLNGSIDVAAYVETLKGQTYADWESIIVDDGSTDGTPELLRHFIAGDNRFRLAFNYLSRKVPGPYQARNLGLSLARGDFICFLDIDDRWLPNKLESQDQQLNSNHELRLVYSPYYRAFRGSFLARLRCSLPLLGSKFLIRFANPIPMLTACVSRNAIGGLKFEPLHHEDYVFWHAILRRLRPACIAESSSPLAIYCVHEDSLSSDKLQVIGWIWKCYGRFGYGFFPSLCALLARGLLQIWLKASEYIAHPVVMDAD